MSGILKNYASIAISFVLFAIFVVILDISLENQRYAYIYASLLLIVFSIFDHIYKVRFFRGFSPYALLIVIPSAAFPLDDLGLLPLPNVTLYVAFGVMLLALPIIWWVVWKNRFA